MKKNFNSPWVVFFWFYFVFYLNERNKWQSASAAWPWHQPESLFRSSLILFLWKKDFRTKFMVPEIRKIVITKSHVRVKKIKRDILEWRSILKPLRSRNNAIWLANKTRSDFELRCRALLITQNYLWCWNLISFVQNLRFKVKRVSKRYKIVRSENERTINQRNK